MNAPHDQLTGRPVVGPDGHKIGDVADVYYDRDTNQPEWALVRTGLFGTKHSFVPITDAAFDGDALQVAFPKDVVKDAPRIEDDGQLSEEEEATLARHYGMSYAQDASGPTTDSAMTRSEEELRVGTTRRPSQLARLRKEVVTEHVTTTVPVEKEILRVEREPITDANVDQALDGPELSDEVAEIVLSEEEVVVDKRVVPKERVRLDKDVVTEDRQVDETVRKEQIEVEQGKPAR